MRIGVAGFRMKVIGRTKKQIRYLPHLIHPSISHSYTPFGAYNGSGNSIGDKEIKN